MFHLKKELAPQNNKVTAFFPINTKDRKDIFDWSIVLGHFIKYCYRRQIPSDSLDEFEETCRELLLQKLDEPEFWSVIKAMYFQGQDLFKISPELLLFKAQKVAGNSANKRLGDFFLNLLQENHLVDKPPLQINFLEREIVNAFEAFILTKGKEIEVTERTTESPYLPFMSQSFYSDLKFLISKPNYFLNNITDFLRLYAFLYTAQLSLNLDAWQQGEPIPRKCFFILDNEKASDERTWIKDYGYKQLERNFWKVFPYLAMAESLQEPKKKKIPLWRIAEELTSNQYLSELNTYIQDFADDRGFNKDFAEQDTSIEAIRLLLSLSLKQFDKAETRHEVNVSYKKAIETELCGHFIQNRGRAGRVLVFNQDYILLLSNLAIGNNREQMRFHELIIEFESRGVFFDKQTQKVLVDFYERIGNVERMSDSGDAVYVRKTI